MVVSYSISTSNHNIRVVYFPFDELYLIPFLHQTTTYPMGKFEFLWLYLIPFLHQTTTRMQGVSVSQSCILFHFYIKPQRFIVCIYGQPVVSYSISTSNHNFARGVLFHSPVVSYSISTSNHNFGFVCECQKWLYLIPFLHQTTTFRC